jgi:hypothetical protein
VTDKPRRAHPPPKVASPKRSSRPARPAEPEIRIAMTPAGRETLDAITDELGLTPRPSTTRTLHPRDSGPEIVVVQGPAGRDTLAAIAEELRTEPRGPRTTLPYGDRVPNAPGATTPSRPPRPDVAIGRRRSDKPTRKTGALPAAEPTRVFEVLTFLVQHPEPSALLSEESRRAFVEARVLQRLPGKSMQRVGRIDVSPWTERETVVLRVWLLVDPSE